jgi:hypothetical protein
MLTPRRRTQTRDSGKDPPGRWTFDRHVRVARLRVDRHVVQPDSTAMAAHAADWRAWPPVKGRPETGKRELRRAGVGLGAVVARRESGCRMSADARPRSRTLPASSGAQGAGPRCHSQVWVVESDDVDPLLPECCPPQGNDGEHLPRFRGRRASGRCGGGLARIHSVRPTARPASDCPRRSCGTGSGCRT